MKKVPTCVFFLLGLLVHYAYAQRPLSAANQTIPLQPLPALPPRANNKTMLGNARSNPNSTPTGSGLGPKDPNKKILDDLRKRVSNKSRTKLQPLGNVSAEGELPIGLPPQSVDVNGGDFATLPPLVAPENFNRGAGGSVNGAQLPGSSPANPLDGGGGKRPKSKYTELMFGQNKPSSSQRRRNKFDELRNMTRQSTTGKHNNGHSIGRLMESDRRQSLPKVSLQPQIINYDPNEQINILPVKSSMQLPNLGISRQLDTFEDSREDILASAGIGGAFMENDTTPGPDGFHPKYLENHEQTEDGDQLTLWPNKYNESLNTHDPVKKIKSRFNMNNVRNSPIRV